jgi:hypothetical protein
MSLGALKMTEEVAQQARGPNKVNNIIWTKSLKPNSSRPYLSFSPLQFLLGGCEITVQ